MQVIFGWRIWTRVWLPPMRGLLKAWWWRPAIHHHLSGAVGWAVKALEPATPQYRLQFYFLLALGRLLEPSRFQLSRLKVQLSSPVSEVVMSAQWDTESQWAQAPAHWSQRPRPDLVFIHHLVLSVVPPIDRLVRPHEEDSVDAELDVLFSWEDWDPTACRAQPGSLVKGRGKIRI